MPPQNGHCLPVKTACTVQCPVCPFRPTALRNWLGSYTAATVTSTLWHGEPFFCHSKIGYESDGWQSRAARAGKLCLGGLRFSDLMMAPPSDDPEIAAARATIDASQIACMTPQQFGAWHDGHSSPVPLTPTTDPMKTKTSKTKKAAKPAPKPIARKRTDSEIQDEVALLRDLRPRIRSHSMFGDDNRILLQAEIDALAGGWEESDLDSEFDSSGLEEEQQATDGSDDPIDHSREIEELVNQRNAAQEAINWRDGQKAEAPSDSYASLVEC